MIFLGHCPDSIGLVAKISGFFAEHDLNILNLEEHTERGEFFIRISTPEISEKTSQGFSRKFSSLAEKISMEWEVFDEQRKTKVVLFCSKSLPTPLEIILGEISGSLSIEIVHIISNFSTIAPLAEKFGIPFTHIPTQEKKAGEIFSSDFSHETVQLRALKNIDYDCIALARYMKVISSEFLSEIPEPIINIHHSFLPSFIGGNPYELAFTRGVKLIGATSHFVTADLDQGPIIEQDVFHIGHRLSLQEMKKQGANIEKKVFSAAIQKFSQHKIIEWKGRTIVFS